MNSAAAVNRKARRAKENRRRTSVAAAAVATTAAALTVGITAPSAAPRVVSIDKIMLAVDPINIDLDLITTGAIFGLVSALGYDTIPYSVDFQGTTLNLNVNLNYANNRPQDLYDTINALPMEKDPYGPLDIYCTDNKNAKGCRIAPVVTIGSGAQGLRSAMNSLFSIAAGTNLQQYAALVEGFTATNAIIVNNPFRPNGGIDGRFGAALQKLGFSPAANDEGTVVENNLLDLTWEYQPQADFPVTFNPLALVNSFMGVLPPITDLLTTKPLDIFEKQIATSTGVGGPTYAPGAAENFGNLISVLGWFSGATSGDELVPYSSVFATLVSGTLPMFEPNALGTYITNSLLKRINSPFLFGDVISDLFTPAMKILVNIAYPDVITPDALKANPELAEAGYGPYDRTFAQQQIDFGTVQPLTFGQQLQAYGDAWNAFTTSLTEQFKKPFFGIVVPNTIPGSTAAAPASATPVRPAAAAAVAEAPAAPVALADTPAAPVVAEAPAAEAPVAEAPAPVSVPAAVEDSAPPAIELADEAPAETAPVTTARGRSAESSAPSASADDAPGGRGSGHSGTRGRH